MLQVFTRRILPAGVFLVCLGGLAGVIQAGTLQYTVNMAETPEVAADPSNMAAAMMAAWNTQQVLMVQRKMPYIYVSFDDVAGTTTTAALTHLQIKIGEPAKYSFDLASIISSSPGVTVSASGPTSVLGQTRSDTIDLAFTNLNKGEFAMIRTDLVSDDGTVLFPDYRTVMFDMNSNNPSDNSMFTATFKDGANTVVSGPNMFNDQIMLYQTQIGIGFTSAYTMDHVQAFQTTFNAGQVPEPSTIALGAMGLLGMVGVAWRRRRPVVPSDALAA